MNPALTNRQGVGARRTALVCWPAVLLAVLLWPVPAGQARSEAPPLPVARKIMAGDRLRISVQEQPDFDRVYAVAGDGTVDFGFLGRVNIEELTIDQAEEQLKELLESRYFRKATVDIEVSEYVEGDILVMGAIASPGTLGFRGDQLLTLFEAISTSGGLSSGADARQVRILRWKPGGSMERESITVDVQSMFDNLDFRSDQFLRARDIVYVPSLGGGKGANEFLILGEVGRPGFYPYSPGLDMIRVIMLMGGVSGSAQLESTRILRSTGGGSYVPLAVDLARLLGAADMTQNVAMQAGDILFIPSTRHASGGRVYILGEVGTPGAVTLQFDRDNTLTKVLLRSGVKPTEFANLGNVRVMRRAPDGTRQTLTINVERIMKKGTFEEDVPLRDDDVIIIPEKIFSVF